MWGTSLFDPRHSILPEIARIVRPGGVILLEEPLVSSPHCSNQLASPPTSLLTSTYLSPTLFSRIPQEVVQPFRSRTPNNPHLDRVITRHKERMNSGSTSSPAMRAQDVARLTWGLRMVDELKSTEGFRAIDGGRVQEETFVLPLGSTESDGTPCWTSVS